MTNNVGLKNAISNGTQESSSWQYSITEGGESHYFALISFTPLSLSGPAIVCPAFANGLGCGYLPAPSSGLTTGIEDFVSFSVTADPWTPSVIVWYTGPQGNLTGVSRVTAGASPHDSFFDVSAPGNYSIHMRPAGCDGSCTIMNATGTVSVSLSTVTYTHPYVIAGLATIVVAGFAITAATLFLAGQLGRKLFQKW